MIDLFGGRPKQEEKYEDGIKPITYVPRGVKPNILELCDMRKTKKLIRDIQNSSVSEEEKAFLTAAAYRHCGFNYSNVADYYAHSDKEMQSLMESSGLVIIDFNSAIANGFIKLCKNIKKKYLGQYG